MAKNQGEPLVRDEQTLRYLREGVKKIQARKASVEEQQKIWNSIGEFFAEEIEEAVSYTGKLASFRDCGGTEGRKALLQQEAELIIWEQLSLNPEQYKDFNAYLRSFREKVQRKLRQYTQQARRESFHVDMPKNTRKTGENEKCTIVAGGKAIPETLNPDAPQGEDAEDFMDRKMGTYHSL